MTVAPSWRQRATLTNGAKRGITTVTGIPKSFPCQDKPRAWLPAEAAMTPRFACAGVSCARALRAPRSLKLPVRCRNSCLQKIWAPVSSLKADDSTQSVRLIEPFKRERAATISESVTLAAVSGFFMDK